MDAPPLLAYAFLAVWTVAVREGLKIPELAPRGTGYDSCIAQPDEEAGVGRQGTSLNSQMCENDFSCRETGTGFLPLRLSGKTNRIFKIKSQFMSFYI